MTFFHQGELAVQRRLGVQDQAQRVASVYRSDISENASEFISTQSMLLLASVDGSGGLWASLILGQPGFVQALGPSRLRINLANCHGLHDVFYQHLRCNPQIALLFIDFKTRRRWRVNGHLAQVLEPDSDELLVNVDRSYGNCPKYIQSRSLVLPILNSAMMDPAGVETGNCLSPEQQDVIQRADTCFVASAEAQQGCDVSHRGGAPGFVSIQDPQHLRIPDYAGNNLFNTLGNLVVNPRAGLLFIDFERHAVLQLSGTANLPWLESKTELEQVEASERYWEFCVTQLIYYPLPDGIDWSIHDYSAFIPPLKRSL